jgi:cyclic pyranopterin monophosphate synthase
MAVADGAEHSDERLTHVDEHGKAHMVDITAKPPTLRIAEARCSVRTAADPAAVLAEPWAGTDLIETARVAGILAAKKVPSLIPLCHSIRIDAVQVDVTVVADGFEVVAVAEVTERTGVEMEALTACATSALVLFQAVLDADPQASIEALTLWRKSGGRSGSWRRPQADPVSQGSNPRHSETDGG